MNKNYEIIESSSDSIWPSEITFLRHKKTRLSIVILHREDCEQNGFQYFFKTPIDNQFLGTAHVLEHMIFTGSKKYNFDLSETRKFLVHSELNGYTSRFFSKYIFSSGIETEVLKMLPVFADFVFFPQLSENSFLQECFRVEFIESNNGEKTRFKQNPVGIAWTEMKDSGKETLRYGGSPYKMHELTIEKVIEFHKKYYTPENCCLVYEGESDIETVLSQIDSFMPELEKEFPNQNKSNKKFITKAALEKMEFLECPEKLRSQYKKWPHEFNHSITLQDFFFYYWADGISPVTPFITSSVYSYTAYKDVSDVPVYRSRYPKHKTDEEVVLEYMNGKNLDEYKEKLKKLHMWQKENHDEDMMKALSPLAVDLFNPYDYKINFKSKNTKAFSFSFSKTKTCFISVKIPQKSLEIVNACKVYGLWLNFYIEKIMRQKGELYSVQVSFDDENLIIETKKDTNSEKTKEKILEILASSRIYNFTMADIVAARTQLLSFLFCKSNMEKKAEYSNMYKVLPEDLHIASEILYDNLEESMY